MDKSRRFFLVLGMHRSGTSCLAGSLELCGLYLGDVRRTGHFNAKGYFEIKEVELLHDQILGLNKGTWYAPPQQVLVHPYHRKALEKIARRLSQHPPSGIKDPRLLLLLDAWMELAPFPSQLVGTFRHPHAVAQSLAHRNRMSQEEGFRLWLHYNDCLVRQHQTEPFPLVEFDLSDVATYSNTIEALAISLGLRPNAVKLRTFVSASLDHHSTCGTMPSACLELYQYLKDNRFRP